MSVEFKMLMKAYIDNNSLDDTTILNEAKKYCEGKYRNLSTEFLEFTALQIKFDVSATAKYQRGELDVDAYTNAKNHYSIAFQSYQNANTAWEQGLAKARHEDREYSYRSTATAPKPPEKIRESEYIRYFVEPSTLIENFAFESEWNDGKLNTISNRFEKSNVKIDSILKKIRVNYHELIKKYINISKKTSAIEIKASMRDIGDPHFRKCSNSASKKAEKIFTDKLKNIYYDNLNININLTPVEASEFTAKILAVDAVDLKNNPIVMLFDCKHPYTPIYQSSTAIQKLRKFAFWLLVIFGIPFLLMVVLAIVGVLFGDTNDKAKLDKNTNLSTESTTSPNLEITNIEKQPADLTTRITSDNIDTTANIETSEDEMALLKDETAPQQQTTSSKEELDIDANIFDNATQVQPTQITVSASDNAPKLYKFSAKVKDTNGNISEIELLAKDKKSARAIIRDFRGNPEVLTLKQLKNN